MFNPDLTALLKAFHFGPILTEIEMMFAKLLVSDDKTTEKQICFAYFLCKVMLHLNNFDYICVNLKLSYLLQGKYNRFCKGFFLSVDISLS